MIRSDNKRAKARRNVAIHTKQEERGRKRAEENQGREGRKVKGEGKEEDIGNKRR